MGHPYVVETVLIPTVCRGNRLNHLLTRSRRMKAGLGNLLPPGGCRARVSVERLVAINGCPVLVHQAIGLDLANSGPIKRRILFVGINIIVVVVVVAQDGVWRHFLALTDHIAVVIQSIDIVDH